MESLENTLVSLTWNLRAALRSMKGQVSQELHSSLHDSTRLADKRLGKLAADAIDLLHETQQLLEPGPMILADHFLGYADSKCLSAAVAYNIPDHLHDGPKSVSDLAAASGTAVMQLRRIMRVLSNNGIFKLDVATDTCSNNHVSELLCSGHWTRWKYWIELYGSEFYDMARGIPAACDKDSVKSPGQIEFNTDKSMFAYFSERGWVSRLHQTLSAGAVAQAPGLVEDYPWESLEDCPFLDVGGGTGALVASVLRKFPSLSGGVLETAEVIEKAKVEFFTKDGQFADVGARIPQPYFHAGDFLSHVPSFEVYTMKWCLHDWDDDHVLKILTNIRKAILKGPRSRLIIFESVLQNGRSSRLSRYADLNMWIAVNGQERTEAHWRSLASRTGWTTEHIYSLRNAWPCAIDLRPVWYEVEDTDSAKIEANHDRSPILDGSRTRLDDEKIEEAQTEATVNGNSIPEVAQVQTSMTFIEPWDKSKGNPFFRSAAGPGMKSVNFKTEDSSVAISDARGKEREFSLDKNGFAYVNDTGGLTAEVLDAIRNGDNELVQRLYYPHVETLIRKETGASRVIIFDHTMRKRDPNRDKRDNADGKEQPATMVHCDQSGKGALRRLKQNLGEDEDYDSIVKGRIQMINVWRPLNGTVVDWPLAQIDFTSLNPEHVHPVDLWRGEWEDRGQTVIVEHCEGQRWWYLGGQRTDEVTLLKIWDSWGSRGVADVCPHAAFKHPDTPVDAEPRESVEVRCLVLHDPAE